MKRTLSIAVMVLIAFAFLAIAPAAANPAWSIQTVDSTGDVGWCTSIAIDSAGYPHISYCDNTNDDLKYAKWTVTGWDITTVDSAGDVGWYTFYCT